MGHRFGSLLILLLLAALGSAPDAQAVRKARVRVPTPLLKKVGDPPEVLRVLAAGTALHTSDQAKDGHYKAMTSDGVVGVIRGDALQFFEAPQTPA
ncbi:MAG: hypothetical protein NDJ90_11635, partial [Oligoflexia bacterium]|nr:hypothetical protein [Oligoflexia bacterium]